MHEGPKSSAEAPRPAVAITINAQAAKQMAEVLRLISFPPILGMPFERNRRSAGVFLGSARSQGVRDLSPSALRMWGNPQTLTRFKNATRFDATQDMLALVDRCTGAWLPWAAHRPADTAIPTSCRKFALNTQKQNIRDRAHPPDKRKTTAPPGSIPLRTSKPLGT
jgi:hypothetical protein